VNLLSVLARVGLTLGRRGPWSRLRGAALLVGTFVLSLGLVGLVLTAAYTEQRDARAQAIRPHPAAPSQATALASFDGFTELDDRPVTVVSIWPLGPDAPLPPGVTKWPAPGEAVVSPAVLADLATSDRNLFGNISSVIGPEGVEVPQERRVYLRPSAQVFSPDRMDPIDGFGGRSDGAGYGVGVLYSAPTWQVNALVISTLITPALVTLALAAGLDGEARERRTRLLTAMGAGRRQRAVVDVAEAAPAVLLGSLAGVVATALLSIWDVALGGLDARLSSADARSSWPMLVLALAAAPALALVCVVLVRARPRWRKRRSLLALDLKPQLGRAAFCILAALATIWVPTQSRSASTRTLTYCAGTIVVAVTLPALVGVILRTVGEAAALQGLRRGSAGSLLGGRRLHRFPRRTARLALGVCFGVLILGQVQLWASQLGEQYHGAVAVRQQLGNSVAVAGNTTYGPAMGRYLNDLPTDAHPLWWSIEPPPSDNPLAPVRTILRGDCADLAAVGLPCKAGPLPQSIAPRLAQILRWGPNVGNVTVIPTKAGRALTNLEAQHAQLVLVSDAPGGLPLPELQREAYAHLPGGLQLATLGQSSVTPGRNLLIEAGWIVLLGALGVLALTIATGCAMAGDVITSTRNLAPLTVLTGRRRWLYVVTSWRTTLPLALAGTLGAGLYLILPTGLSTGTFSMDPSPRLAVAAAGGSLLMGVMLSIWSARQVLRAGGDWRPTHG
jgi:hypothetical protein